MPSPGFRKQERQTKERKTSDHNTSFFTMMQYFAASYNQNHLQCNHANISVACFANITFQPHNSDRIENCMLPIFSSYSRLCNQNIDMKLLLFCSVLLLHLAQRAYVFYVLTVCRIYFYCNHF